MAFELMPSTIRNRRQYNPPIYGYENYDNETGTYYEPEFKLYNGQYVKSKKKKTKSLFSTLIKYFGIILITTILILLLVFVLHYTINQYIDNKLPTLYSSLNNDNKNINIMDNMKDKMINELTIKSDSYPTNHNHMKRHVCGDESHYPRVESGSNGDERTETKKQYGQHRSLTSLGSFGDHIDINDSELIIPYYLLNQTELLNSTGFIIKNDKIEIILNPFIKQSIAPKFYKNSYCCCECTDIDQHYLLDSKFTCDKQDLECNIIQYNDIYHLNITFNNIYVKIGSCVLILINKYI